MSTAEPAAEPMTADRLLSVSRQLSMRGERCELVEGELKTMSPSGNRHARLAMRLGSKLDQFVEDNHLGACFSAEGGFLIDRNPDTVRAPDVAFVKKSRIDAIGFPTGYFPEAPTLAVEVVSPGDSAKEVHEKAAMWITAGCEAVWLVWPDSRELTVYRSLDNIRILREDQALDGEEVLPGLSIRVGEIFEGLGG